MTIRDGQPSPEQARKMARVFVIATLLGGLVVFLNVAMRSYNIRMQQAELKKQQATGEVVAPGSQAPGEMTTPGSQAPGEMKTPGSQAPGEMKTPGSQAPGEMTTPGSQTPGATAPGETPPPATPNATAPAPQ